MGNKEIPRNDSYKAQVNKSSKGVSNYLRGQGRRLVGEI